MLRLSIEEVEAALDDFSREWLVASIQVLKKKYYLARLETNLKGFVRIEHYLARVANIRDEICDMQSRKKVDLKQ